jgi:hypothetical protein
LKKAAQMRRNRLRGFVELVGNCGKKRYPHERAARETAEHQMRRAGDNGEYLQLRVYQCPHGACGGWHLTEVR